MRPNPRVMAAPEAAHDSEDPFAAHPSGHCHCDEEQPITAATAARPIRSRPANPKSVEALPITVRNARSDRPGVSGDAGSGTQSFGYDALNRVTSSTGLANSLARAYTYDRDSNRATKVTGTFPTTTTFTYAVDRTDELITVTKTGQSAKSFAYDAHVGPTDTIVQPVDPLRFVRSLIFDPFTNFQYLHLPDY